jgi:hypothetical protein
VVARLKSSISLEEAQKDVADSLQSFLQKYPPHSQFEAPMLFSEAFEAIPLRDAMTGDVRPAF